MEMKVNASGDEKRTNESTCWAQLLKWTITIGAWLLATHPSKDRSHDSRGNCRSWTISFQTPGDAKAAQLYTSPRQEIHWIHCGCPTSEANIDTYIYIETCNMRSSAGSTPLIPPSSICSEPTAVPSPQALQRGSWSCRVKTPQPGTCPRLALHVG